MKCEFKSLRFKLKIGTVLLLILLLIFLGIEVDPLSPLIFFFLMKWFYIELEIFKIPFADHSFITQWRSIFEIHYIAVRLARFFLRWPLECIPPRFKKFYIFVDDYELINNIKLKRVVRVAIVRANEVKLLYRGYEKKGYRPTR